MKRKLSPAELRAIFSKKQGPDWTPLVPFVEDVIKLTRNDSGNYEFFDKNGKMIYVGSTNEIKHRIASYRELDSAKEHPTKVPLRKELENGGMIRLRYVPIEEARIHERNIKDKLGLKFNMDDNKNEEIKRERT